MKYEDLTTFAKLDCIREFVGRIDPYNGDLDTMPLEELEESIKLFLEACDDFSIDDQGRWYFEGMRV